MNKYALFGSAMRTPQGNRLAVAGFCPAGRLHECKERMERLRDAEFYILFAVGFCLEFCEIYDKPFMCTSPYQSGFIIHVCIEFKTPAINFHKFSFAFYGHSNGGGGHVLDIELRPDS